MNKTHCTTTDKELTVGTSYRVNDTSSAYDDQVRKYTHDILGLQFLAFDNGDGRAYADVNLEPVPVSVADENASAWLRYQYGYYD